MDGRRARTGGEADGSTRPKWPRSVFYYEGDQRGGRFSIKEATPSAKSSSLIIL